MEQQECLFGWPPMPWKGRKGRPPHLATPENRNRVKMLLAFGWATSRIANALGVTEPTLRKHYFSELRARDMARDAMDARRAEMLWAQMERGNVGAMKAFDRLVEANDRMRWGRGLRDDDTATGDHEADGPQARRQIARPVRTAPLGKKEAAVGAAERAVSADPDLQPGFPGLIN